MQASDDTRKRLVTVLAIAGTLLGGWALWGAAARWAERRGEPAIAYTPGRISREVARQSRLLRTIRAALTERGRAGDWETVIRLADMACDKNDCPDPIRALRAEAAVRAGKTARAQADFAVLLEPAAQMLSRTDVNPRLGFVGRENPTGRADYLAVSGRRAEYESHRRDLNQMADPDPATPLVANNLAWACALLPGPPADFAKPIARARDAVARASGRERATYLNTLGVLQYRRGDIDAALATLRQAESLQEEPFNWPFLALALRRRGETAEAARWEKKLVDYLDATFGQNTIDQSANTRHELLLFFQEMGQGRRP